VKIWREPNLKTTWPESHNAEEDVIAHVKFYSAIALDATINTQDWWQRHPSDNTVHLIDRFGDISISNLLINTILLSFDLKTHEDHPKVLTPRLV
ncbi:MAG: hypothetical protein Q9226_006817, partial [Calogaya cf. arnoldii]